MNDWSGKNWPCTSGTKHAAELRRLESFDRLLSRPWMKTSHRTWAATNFFSPSRGVDAFPFVSGAGRCQASGIIATNC